MTDRYISAAAVRQLVTRRGWVRLAARSVSAPSRLNCWGIEFIMRSKP